MGETSWNVLNLLTNIENIGLDDDEPDEINVKETTFYNPSQIANKFSEHTFKCEKV